MYINLH